MAMKEMNFNSRAWTLSKESERLLEHNRMLLQERGTLRRQIEQLTKELENASERLYTLLKTCPGVQYSVDRSKPPELDLEG